jgi:hypothetical protein
MSIGHDFAAAFATWRRSNFEAGYRHGLRDSLLQQAGLRGAEGAELVLEIHAAGDVAALRKIRDRAFRGGHRLTGRVVVLRVEGEAAPAPPIPAQHLPVAHGPSIGWGVDPHPAVRALSRPGSKSSWAGRLLAGCGRAGQHVG